MPAVMGRSSHSPIMSPEVLSEHVSLRDAIESRLFLLGTQDVNSQ
jgi:hypothetical protein